MRHEVFWIVLVSELVSLVLIFRLLRSGHSSTYKVIHAAILLVPVAGPLVYWFVTDATPPQNPSLRNDLPRGTYTHYWISLNAVLGRKKSRPKSDSGKSTGE